MFALWRIEPPWQPLSKKGIGKRMGGGKGSIHHYATPVRAERIIVELGGDLHPLEVFIKSNFLSSFQTFLQFLTPPLTEKNEQKKMF